MKIEHRSYAREWVVTANIQREYDALKYLLEALELKWGTPMIFTATWDCAEEDAKTIQSLPDCESRKPTV